MRYKIFAVLLGFSLMWAAGCVSKVSGGKTAGMPFVKDKVEGVYERPLEMVFTAAREVIRKNGVLDTESVVHGETNQVKTLTGKVNQRLVYVKVAPVDTGTLVEVQARTSGGGSDLALAHELEKQIALGLVR
jgi:hypothetical protein